ncbi:DUF2076 domain-containing protein [Pantoea allii]|uniref:DUF2076 domain-containing protein n=1 Tax=Pantoea allii TaxID=574096 RepID=UPI000A244114|nr:DUF2076 domain-containing protein [Pantoea allii]MBW1253331.1 DUF2076 domain-containing protein [Pantoea allii]MBW1262573.1 DUF2076 domain-containing protein [Pantoea allii]MBW1284411.1 DUF2076 domain-containing protein [Pantoea allii]ORM83935.1 ABC transporter substrate-binding protein [Pantoea allii]PBJ99438.1 ABC transporter substrate-binding protein [Pantoea allii]
MQREEQQLIENLFSRLKQAESQTAARDAAAEQLIKQHLQEQPGAPYYMAQAILIQEAALKKLNERVQALENRLAQQQAQQQQQPKSSGGFLSSLFGGGSQQPQPAQQQPQWNSAPQQPPQPQQPYASAPAPRGSGFLGGALQTAVGVAGGVVMADMLTSMFHQSQPQEIVNIINEQPPLPQVDDSLNTFNGGNDQSFLDQGTGADNQSFLDQSNGWSDTYADNGDLNDFGGNDYDDDDSFV